MHLRMLYEADEPELTEPEVETEPKTARFKSWADRPTISPGKLKTTDWAEKQSKVHGYGLCVYLVGAADGLRRHVDDKVRMGFKDLSKHIVVERDAATAQSLTERAAEEYPEITVIHDDFKQACSKIGWNRIEHIDFDGVERYNQYADDLIRQAVKAGVDNIHVTISTRGTSEFIMSKMSSPEIFSRVRALRDFDPTQLPHIEKLIPIVLHDVEKQGYHVSARGYSGHSADAPKHSQGSLKGGHPMRTIVVQKI